MSTQPKQAPEVELRGSRDPETGDVYFPVRTYSVDGTLRELEEVALSSRGVLYTCTTFMDGRVFGQVDLPEGVRLQGELTGDDHTIGSHYRVVGDATNWRFEHA